MLIASRLINLNRTSPDVRYPAPNAHQVAIAMWTLLLIHCQLCFEGLLEQLCSDGLMSKDARRASAPLRSHQMC